MNDENEKLYTRAELVAAVRDLTEDARMGEACSPKPSRYGS